MGSEILKVVLSLSGKGGVGKSTNAVNTAVELSKKYKVGLLDADINSPNLVRMMGLEEWTIEPSAHMKPYRINENLVVMSSQFFITNKDQAIYLPGEKRRKFLQQCIQRTDWGKTEYLIVDMPPGTGDSVIAVIDYFDKIYGVVIITTPENVALDDCRKVLDLCKNQKIRVLGIIENKSHFICSNCGIKHDLYGSNGGKRLAEEAKVELIAQIPFAPRISQQMNSGKPISREDNTVYTKIARNITKKRW